MAERNRLYYGDNLFVLREYIADESVDLVYLDPPFNSNASYNVLFKEHDGAAAASQIRAFEDTWRWDERAVRAYEETVEMGCRLSEGLQAFRKLLGPSDMLAYLSMMAPRIRELHRVLKSTGSIYLHCDPTASHYLKLLLDAVFDARNFRNEIIWKRTTSKSLMKRKLPTNHDVILSSQKSDQAKWNEEAIYRPYDLQNLDEKTRRKYRHRDSDGRLYRLDNLINPNPNRPHLKYEFMGVTKVWRWTEPRMKQALEDGLIVQTKPGAVPNLKRYIDEQRGKPLDDIWTDIPPINSQAAERLGYPTQKPLPLVERIIRMSSDAGDLVLDPFCGCGTTIDAAEKLGRRWIGIDITHLAINLIRHRLHDSFGGEIDQLYDVIGEPTSATDARVLAEQDPYQFQLWALGLVHARPAEVKKGADRGIDGDLYFHDESGGKTKRVIFSVKGGKTTVKDVRELITVVEREGAQMGAVISMHATTQPMRAEAASAGSYESPWGKHPKIQLLTIAELLKGARLDMPSATGVNATFKKARKHGPGGGASGQLLLREVPDVEYG